MEEKATYPKKNPITLRLLALPWIFSLLIVSLIFGIVLGGIDFLAIFGMFLALSFVLSLVYILMLVSFIDSRIISTYSQLILYQIGFLLLTNVVLIMIFSEYEVVLPSIPYFVVGLFIQFLLWRKSQKATKETHEIS